MVFTDLHLRSTGARFPIDELPVTNHDLVISLGDVIDDNRDHAPSDAAGEAYEERGREFFDALNDEGVPVLAVPGNHDPISCTQRLSDGLANITPLHRDNITVAVDGTWELTIAGWGFDQFDFKPSFLASDYPGVSVGPGQTADTAADALLHETSQFIGGFLSESEFAGRLGTAETDESFKESLELLVNRLETIHGLLEDRRDLGLIASHVSPFGVPFDIRGQHSHDGSVHSGSLALRLAVAITEAIGCLSGHTHKRGTTAVRTLEGHAYAHNPGDAGISSVTIHQDGAVQVEAVDVRW
ncbi:metallophosphoesterase family protein [Haloplanus halophilus]|uniref:metallophosphoesterase family protein n=1 Tax=Haloplanus halophilus TaxID=2949993 RepID=UPI00203F9D4E|nr:metallophosphoesterase [Haloplanus sp. GDY1]